MVGRNELCPCGSGKKHKKCCLHKNQSVEIVRNKVLYAKGLYKNMENKVYEYSKSIGFNADREDCMKKFYNSKETNDNIDKLYNSYLIYDYKNSQGKTIVNEFSESNKLTFNKNQRDIISSLMKSNISIFKVEDKSPTKMIVRDYITSNKLTINDIDLFNNIETGESIIARIVNIQGMNLFVHDVVKLSNENINTVIEEINQLYSQDKKSAKDIEEWKNMNTDLIYKFTQQILLNKKLTTITSLETEISEEKITQNNNQNSDIYKILKNNIEEKYLQKCIDLWKKYINSNGSIKGSENGWAAAVEYYIKKDAGEIITQAQVSRKYEVSPTTLGKRYKQLKIS